jgi:pimeloyl-ACP methyl ester carboxylesterase
MKQPRRGFSEEYVPINGIEQYFLHYPAAGSGANNMASNTTSIPTSSEVILTVHGGPGQSEASLAYHVEEDTPDITSVYYDQRGTGKTLSRNSTDGTDVTLEQLLDDLHQTVIYLKRKYQKDKIVIAGHSWGSVLGIHYIKRHPENVLFYLGAGQLVNFKKGERLQFDKLKALAKNSEKDTQTLAQLGDYPENISSPNEFSKASKTLSKIKAKYGLGLDTSKVVKIARKSPVFTFSDVIAMIKAPKVNRNLVDALYRFNIEGETIYDAPIYFIHGAADGQVPIELAEEYLARIEAPAKKLYRVEGAGHIINLDNPQACIAAMRDILGAS